MVNLTTLFVICIQIAKINCYLLIFELNNVARYYNDRNY